MIDMRWLEYIIPSGDIAGPPYGYVARKLQYRVLLPVDLEWTEWADVPTVKEQEE